MLLGKIYNKIKFRRVAIILIRFGDKDTVTFTRYVVEFKHKKTIIESASDTIADSVTELLEDIDPEIPIYLYVLGRGIVHRLFVEDNIEDFAVEDLFPNYNPDQNYYLRADISSKQTSITFFRRKQMRDNILKRFFEDTNVVGFVFGLDPIIAMLDYFDFNKSEVIVENVEFQKSESGYHAHKRDDNPISLFFNGEEHDKNSILAISAAIYFQMKLAYLPLLVKDNVNLLTSKWVNKKIIPAVLGIVFLIVATNYLLLTSYSEQYASKNSQVMQGQKTLKKLDQFKIKISDNERFIKDNGILNSSDYSYFIDVIGEIASEKIRFTRFQIHPLEKEIKNKKEVKFKNQFIIMEGEANSVDNYRIFLEELNSLERLKDIKSQSYRYDLRNRIGKFSIIIEYELN